MKQFIVLCALLLNSVWADDTAEVPVDPAASIIPDDDADISIPAPSDD